MWSVVCEARTGFGPCPGYVCCGDTVSSCMSGVSYDPLAYETELAPACGECVSVMCACESSVVDDPNVVIESSGWFHVTSGCAAYG